MVNVYGCDDECGDIHGKEFHGRWRFHEEFHRSHLEENVRHLREIGERTRRLITWTIFLEKSFMETAVIDW